MQINNVYRLGEKLKRNNRNGVNVCLATRKNMKIFRPQKISNKIKFLIIMIKNVYLVRSDGRV